MSIKIYIYIIVYVCMYIYIEPTWCFVQCVFPFRFLFRYFPGGHLGPSSTKKWDQNTWDFTPFLHLFTGHGLSISWYNSSIHLLKSNFLWLPSKCMDSINNIVISHESAHSIYIVVCRPPCLWTHPEMWIRQHLLLASYPNFCWLNPLLPILVDHIMFSQVSSTLLGVFLHAPCKPQVRPCPNNTPKQIRQSCILVTRGLMKTLAIRRDLRLSDA